jgi:hypothetical protein
VLEHSIKPWTRCNSNHRASSGFQIHRQLTACYAAAKHASVQSATPLPPPVQVTTLVSYLSHSQVWALQEGASLHVGSRTNRATFQFGRDMEAVLDAMPERPPQAPALSDAAASG